MIFLRYICGFYLQIFSYAFFCLYPFWDSFRVNRKRALILAISVLTILAVPFALIGETNFGGDYEEAYCNVIFYIAVLFFLALYLRVIRARISEKLFVFFVVMSYGFFVTRIVSFLFIAFNLSPDKFMYPPVALLMTLGINLLAAKPIMLLMKRIWLMIESGLEARIWHILCVVPVLFVTLASAFFFPEVILLDSYLVAPLYSILITVFAFIIYAAIFRIMDYIRRQQEERRIDERMLESYRSNAENNDRIREIHHEIRHHLNALSAYIGQKDYAGAEQYLRKFSEDADRLPAATYASNPLVNSILSDFSDRAKASDIEINYSVIADVSFAMDDVDLCRILNNMLENAIEGCEKVLGQKRVITFKLHVKGNFMYICCENTCDTERLKSVNGRFVSTKANSRSHGYGLRIIGQIAEKYNGILTTQAENGVFTAATNLCLVNNKISE